MLSLLSQTLENMQASVTAIGDKTTSAVSSLVTCLSPMLENVQASVTAIEDKTTSTVSSLEKRLDVLEEQGVNQFTMVRYHYFSLFFATCRDAAMYNQLANKSRRHVPKDQKFISQKKLVNVHGASYKLS